LIDLKEAIDDGKCYECDFWDRYDYNQKVRAIEEDERAKKAEERRIVENERKKVLAVEAAKQKRKSEINSIKSKSRRFKEEVNKHISTMSSGKGNNDPSKFEEGAYFAQLELDKWDTYLGASSDDFKRLGINSLDFWKEWSKAADERENVYKSGVVSGECIKINKYVTGKLYEANKLAVKYNEQLIDYYTKGIKNKYSIEFEHTNTNRLADIKREYDKIMNVIGWYGADWRSNLVDCRTGEVTMEVVEILTQNEIGLEIRKQLQKELKEYKDALNLGVIEGQKVKGRIKSFVKSQIEGLNNALGNN
jgi:hypothetical protein